MRRNTLSIVMTLALLATFMLQGAGAALAETGPTINFDAYTVGSINGQNGWEISNDQFSNPPTSTNVGGYDVALVANSSYEHSAFYAADATGKSLRISN